MQAREAEEIRQYRASLSTYEKAHLMPDFSEPFKVNYDLVKPPTKPEPFRLSTEWRPHFHAHATADRPKLDARWDKTSRWDFNAIAASQERAR